MHEHSRPDQADLQDHQIVTRAEAKALGLKRYFTGKPCKHGHVALRQVVNKSCEECLKLFHAKLRAQPENKQKMKEYSREYYLQNRKKVLERGRARNATGYNKRYYKENKERFLITVKAWIKNNPKRRIVYRQKRRAGGNGSLLPHHVERIFEQQKGKCAACSVSLRKTGYHIDHIIALSKGGSNDPKNIQLLCPTCNLSKGAKDPIDFMQSLGRLL
jgi:5-methylcytosine-specific restriction endonuclease McrA